jgi:protein tyrosine phosphatase
MIRGEIMINNNLNIDLNPTVSLNSINYKSNQYGESFPYELDKIHPKMLQRDGVVMMMMKVLVMMVLVMMVMKMMIPMKPSSMAMPMATISPLREGISPADFCLPESFISLCVFRPTEAAESISDPPES